MWACICACIVVCLVLGGCFGLPHERSVAATVNGEPVYEDEVSVYIEGFRAKNDEYGTDSGWAAYLAGYGSAEGLRTEVLETVFIPRMLVRQECERRNIQVTDSDLDAVLAEEREYYEGRYGADSWDSVLASYGYDEASWRENEEDRLLEDELSNTVVPPVEPTRSEIQAQANAHASDYNGKHSHYIAFESEAQARAARDKLYAKAKGAVKLSAFRKAGELEDAGWSSIGADRDLLSAEYLNVLNGLDAGAVSEPVEDGGSWRLILCDEIFEVEEGSSFVKLDTVPERIYAQLVDDAREQRQDERFSSWLDQLAEVSEIEIAPMPSGLSYDADSPLAG